jgi:hypothetical protein
MMAKQTASVYAIKIDFAESFSIDIRELCGLGSKITSILRKFSNQHRNAGLMFPGKSN